ncbi:MAG: hypothetical protein H6739_31550 [Alphaproteobacteria bacterium]|nr:hypothetical protein [Alphaproteobacteria bacterium]
MIEHAPLEPPHPEPSSALAVDGHAFDPPGTGAWRRMSEALALEPSLVPVAPERLQARWDAGLSAVLLKGGEIVAHCSAARVYGDQVLEMSTAWVHPAWRGRGELSRLRDRLVRRLGRRAQVLVSVSLGVGLGPHLARRGWRRLGWDALPYFTALIAQDAPLCRPGVLTAPMPDHLPPLRDAPPPDVDPAAWTQLWLSSPERARALDEALEQRWCGDLEAWRQHVLNRWADRGAAGAALRLFPLRRT